MTFAAFIDDIATQQQVALSVGEVQALECFLDELRLWNQKLDLTAARNDANIAEIALADAIALRKTGWFEGQETVVDVGSGAGIPAIPLAILHPWLRMTLVEPLQKRVAFMASAIGKLGLNGRVQVLAVRVEDYTPETLADIAMSRATFAPEIWLTYAARLARSALVLTTPGSAPTFPAHALLHRYGLAKGQERIAALVPSQT